MHRNSPQLPDIMGTAAPVPTIPSLKRTLSGGSAASLVHQQHPGGPPSNNGNNVFNNLASVLQQPPPMMSTTPPPMLRATTSTGVFNRPMPSLGNGGSSLGLGLHARAGTGAGNATGNATGNAMSATTTVPTAARTVTQTAMPDWRMYMTIEERQAVRSKIRDAYVSRCSSYDELLQVACAIEEELLHISAPSRLDYFKSGFEFENRVKLKKEQLQGQLSALENPKRRGSSSPQQSNASNASHPNASSINSPSTNPGGSYAKKQRL